MTSQKIKTLEGVFQNLVYSPNGNVEGVLLEVDGQPAQIVFEAFQPDIYERFAPLAAGTEVVVEVTEQPVSNKGKAAHAVYDLGEVISVDGRDDLESGSQTDGYRGSVVRFNFAKHGEPNGVILDTGDFIHTRPRGFDKLKLRIGSLVEAEGDAHQLVTGQGWAVEARSVNGIDLS